MSDLRERLRICSLAQLYTTRDSDLFSHTRTHRARDEAALSEDFLSPPTHTNTSVLIQRVSGQIRALCDTPLGYPNDGILPLLHFDAKYDSSHVESLIRLLYRGVLRWMSDLRERLRICSLAQLSLLEITCISSLIREPTEPATKRLSRRTFFLFLSRTPRGLCRLSVPRRPPLRRAAASLPHHQPAPPPRSPRSAAHVDSVSSESGHGFRLGRRRHVDSVSSESGLGFRLGRRPRRPRQRLRLLRLPRLLLARATAHRRQRQRHHAAHGLHQPSVQPRLAARLRGRASGAALLRLPEVPSNRQLVQPGGRLRVPAAIQLRAGQLPLLTCCSRPRLRSTTLPAVAPAPGSLGRGFRPPKDPSGCVVCVFAWAGVLHKE